MSVLRCENLSKSFDGTRALAEVSVTFPENGIVAVIGPNGAGKTTLASLIRGFHRPAGGRIRSDGFHMNEIDLHVSLLGHWGRLKWKQDEQGLYVRLPATPPSASAVTLKIKDVV